MSAPDHPIVIVGGGIAGLAAAYELTRSRAPFVLLERAERLGGVILTERTGGFVVDAGPDALLVHKPAAIALCQELGLGERLVPTNPPRTAFILRGGRLHPLPEASILGLPTRLGPLAASGLFSWRGKLRMGAEWFIPRRTARDRASAGDESIAQFMRRRFGQEAVDYLAEPLMAGIHAGDVEALSMRSAFPLFLELEDTHGSLLRAFRKRPRRPSVQGVFRSLPGGLGELVDALGRALPSGSVRLGARVAGLEAASREGCQQRTARPRYRVRLSSGESIEAAAVILAVPAYVAADLLAPLDADSAAICRAVPYVSTATVVLGYPRDAVRHPLAGSGLLIPRVERGWTLMAASWVSSKWPGRAPAGHVLLRAFLGGTRAPSLVDQEDEALTEMAQADLRRLLGVNGQPTLVRVYRWVRANAQHTVGHLDRVATLERRLERWPGLFLTGSAFRGTGIPDCVEDGRAVARRAASDDAG